jgi:tetratricopeptide (TPR) repeat protein
MLIKPWYLLCFLTSPVTAQTAWEAHTRQGSALEQQGRYAEAAREFTAALPETDPARLPITLDSLGVVYRELGNYPEAERCYRRAIAILETAAPPRPLELARALHNFGALRLVLGRPSQAEPLYRRAYQLRLQALGPKATEVGATLHGLAEAAHERRRFDEAEELYRRAAAILESAYGPASPAVADVWHNWAALYRETRRDAQARPLLEGAAAIYEKKNPLHPKLAIVLRNLAGLEAAAGNTARAQALFDRSLHICDAALPADHPQTGIILQAYGKFLEDTHRKNEANLVKQRARAILAKGARETGTGLTVDVSAFSAGGVTHDPQLARVYY